MIGKQTLDVQQRMHRDAVEIAHDDRGSRRAWVLHRRGSVQVGLKRNSKQRVIKPLERLSDAVVMPAHGLAQQYENESDENGYPTALRKLGGYGYEQNRPR